MRKLTTEQIENLYEFTASHYVEWYDLQIELVDHLANDIEESWADNPKMNFEAAKLSAFKKFGIFGFGEVVESRLNSLNKKYNRMMWDLFLAFFKIPKILMLLCLYSFVFYGFEKIGNSKGLLLVILIAYTLFSIYRLFQLKKGINNRFKLTNKKYLTDHILLNFTKIGFVFWYPVSFGFNWDKVEQFSIGQNAVIALFVVIMMLFGWIGLVKIPNKMDEYMAAMYPSYIIST
ncbi:hypothetical protein DNU06_14500 [Putridiphycobacter roseus]|uniref:Uncharacterized protein n=1 Tax=Putridiphycobacter roseus TaxID=2219161 RepID=A0A2W1MYA1_9FLAO|nr:hypothetical protein [Putridiphycobacter roseus]PZE16170.1 hypothetical protein DNU06_14500 [Putridiphycobacter roseus]